MQKIALFVEGLTEAAFIRTLLLTFLKADRISIIFITLGSSSAKSPHDHKSPSPTLYFLIINVGGDGNVLGSIKDREKRLLEEGYLKIIGLQDLNCDEYDKLSRGTIDNSVTSKFIKGRREVITQMSIPDKIKFFFSIMEIEAWFLSLPKAIYRVDPDLNKTSVKFICKKDLESVNPETEFYKPSSVLESIYASVNKKYNKSLSCVLSLTNKIQRKDIEELLQSNKCSAFKLFFDEIMLGNESLKT